MHVIYGDYTNTKDGKIYITDMIDKNRDFVYEHTIVSDFFMRISGWSDGENLDATPIKGCALAIFYKENPFAPIYAIKLKEDYNYDDGINEELEISAWQECVSYAIKIDKFDI